MKQILHIFLLQPAGRFKISGTLQSMLNYKRACLPYCFYNLFNGCTRINSSSGLVFGAEFLAEYCYKNLFYNCSKMTSTVSEIPFKILKSNCYEQMFKLTGISTAPALPATALASNCYLRMFENCPQLIVASELPATILASDCYKYMFYKCGALQTPP